MYFCRIEMIRGMIMFGFEILNGVMLYFIRYGMLC